MGPGITLRVILKSCSWMILMSGMSGVLVSNLSMEVKKFLQNLPTCEIFMQSAQCIMIAPCLRSGGLCVAHHLGMLTTETVRCFPQKRENRVQLKHYPPFSKTTSTNQDTRTVQMPYKRLFRSIN